MSILYQTLEDRDNVDYVELNGPFLGNIRYTWLGKGYYYWDTFINLAHFWGWTSYKRFKKNYIIAKTELTLPPEKTLNLLDPNDIQKFTTWIDEYELTFPNKTATIEKVITHTRTIMGSDFPYVAIKAQFINCINQNEYQRRISPNGKAYLDLQPPIQVCILDKSIIGPNNFKVIYPTNYSDEAAFTF